MVEFEQTQESQDEEEPVYRGANCLRAHEVESGTTVAEICRKPVVSERTFCRWKEMFAGMGIPGLRRLRQLEEENRKLKQLVQCGASSSSVESMQ